MRRRLGMNALAVFLFVVGMVTYVKGATMPRIEENFEKLPPLPPPEGINDAVAAANNYVAAAHQRIHEKYGKFSSGPNPILSAEQEKARREPYMKGSEAKTTELKALIAQQLGK